MALASAAVAAAICSCSDKAVISGVLSDAPGVEITVKQFSGSAETVLDTLKTDAAGGYSCKVAVKEGQPELVYLYKGDTKLASLILGKGDRVKVVSDTLGSYTVEGSEESALLKQADDEFNSFMAAFSADLASGDGPKASRDYVAYYRKCIKFVMENPKSLASVMVLSRKINENFPVFSQATDALIFETVHDSLQTVIPESKYVAALGREAGLRRKQLDLDLQLKDAPEIGYPDLTLPSYDGSRKKLSETVASSKAVLVYFWTAADAAQKLFNNDVLLPVYNDFHPKGFEIYSVSLDADKSVWADAVKNQKLPWINVCDGLGSVSPAAVLYNIYTVPVAFLLVDGQMTSETIEGEKDLRRVLSAKL